MDYSFNGQFGFPWNPSNPFMSNQFNNPNPAQNGFTNGQSAGNMQSFNGSSGGFNNQGVYGGPRFPPGIMPFGPYGPQSGNQNSQNTQFGTNWNFGYPGQTPVINTFNQMPQQLQQQNVPANSLNTAPSSECPTVKKESVDTNTQSSSDISDKIALKVSSMLAKSLQNNNNPVDEGNDDTDSASDNEMEFRQVNNITADLGLTNTTLDLSYTQKKTGNVP